MPPYCLETHRITPQLELQLLSPARLAAKPLLLFTFALDWQSSLLTEPYNLTAKCFLEQGHRVASFDLPHHGKRIPAHGPEIHGFRNALLDGQNPFELFTGDAKKAVDFCIAKNLAQPPNIAVCGTSRAGYLALRWAGEDPRITAAAAFAPVTDWRYLAEFEGLESSDEVAREALTHFIPRLVGKSVFIAIGNKDERVSTPCCIQFYQQLLRAHNNNGAKLEFQVSNSPGHASQSQWHFAAARFLMSELQDVIPIS